MRWENTILINAPVGTVWDLTTDVANWPFFMPTMQRVERLDDGPMRVGSSARVKQPGQTSAVWTVTTLVDGSEFRWSTRRPGMTMTGSHLLEADPSGGCRNTLVLDAVGPAAAVFGTLFGRMFAGALDLENSALKARAERAG